MFRKLTHTICNLPPVRLYAKDHCRAILFDIDGVLIRGKSAIKGAKESLFKLQKAKVPFAFLTNGGGVLESVKTEQLMKYLNSDDSTPIKLCPEHMIVSHSPMKALVEKYKNEKVLIIGDLQSDEVAMHYGFNKSIGIKEFVLENPSIHPPSSRKMEALNNSTREEKKVKLSTIAHDICQISNGKVYDDPFKAILVMHDPDDFGRDLQVAMDVLLSDGSPGAPFNLRGPQKVKLYMSNPDLLYSGTFPTARFGQGLYKLCLQAVYKEMTDRDLEITQFGKPMKVTYEYAEKKLEQIAKELGHDVVDVIYAVGDNPRADIRGANNAGDHYHSVLVKTGVFTGDEPNDPNDPAKTVVNDVNEFVDKFLAGKV
jgi:HAD superfamily hydrolase (TIGR01456 family)